MSHLKQYDYIAHILNGTPLPCSCEECARRMERWTCVRAFPAAQSEEMPPGFWARQEAAIAERLVLRAIPIRRWAVAFSAVAFILALGVFLFIRPSREARWKNIETQYDALQTSLDRPDLGDLEACSLVLNEPSDLSEEETL